MQNQLDLLEEVNHNLGRAEAMRDAVVIVKSYAEHIRSQADERESSIREHLKAFPEGRGGVPPAPRHRLLWNLVRTPLGKA